ncbi:Arc family DNA-binding protein [Acinetobacter junii]|uniref:Arc family DNA-binding protein n=1 Tax=Acinetobacter junii TaxID=40215 RepID=UPI001250405D|nr:Arc family DNA-binding protein [Acinetobacter junii]
MARTDPQINIRVPAELKKELELMAVENGRSLNAEVVLRLEQSFNPAPSGLSREQLEQITQAAGASYMAVIAKHLESLSEEEGNKVLRNIVKEAAEDFERIKKAP